MLGARHVCTSSATYTLVAGGGHKTTFSVPLRKLGGRAACRACSPGGPQRLSRAAPGRSRALQKILLSILLCLGRSPCRPRLRSRREHMREVKWLGAGLIQVFDDFGDKGYQARLFTRTRSGWSPPLPPDIELSTTQPLAPSISRSACMTSAERPYWQLREPEPWRLRR